MRIHTTSVNDMVVVGLVFPVLASWGKALLEDHKVT